MSRRRIVLAAVLYAALSAAGLAWGALAGRPNVAVHAEPWLALVPWKAHLASLAMGVLLALFTVWSTRVLVDRAAFARRLHDEFRRLLGPMSRATVALLALGSSVGEEIFFRGAMQPWAGWLATSVVFGLLHVGPSRTLLPWTVWAVAMGLCFGAIFESTGSLVGPLVAHAWINYRNLRFIGASDPRRPGSAPPPRLVGPPTRRP
ncbi:MAG: CPBP family intramembrane metalloprotease [Sandaracinaceae bacterium]|nr:CPBP family intramembrane metalloprotease [Sandaracinaceae bacterium]